MPDVVSSFYKRKATPGTSKKFISKMIDSGKELYFKDVLLPEYSDTDKMDIKEQIDGVIKMKVYVA
jgi:hypothetical protein